MGVQFSIDGHDPKTWSCDFNNRNAYILAKVIDLDLDQTGFGVYGELSPAECVTYMASIEEAMLKDLSEYAVNNSSTRAPVGAGITNGNVTQLQFGPRVINQGIDEEGIKRRLRDLYLLFQKAVEVNCPITWA